MTPHAHTRLQTELAALRRSGPSIEVPDDYMDYDDNLVARHVARRVRIRQIQDLLTNAVVGEDPPDDGFAEPGMVLTVRYDDTGEIETFLLGVRGAEDADIEVYSMQSPLGRAIAGARPGAQRTYSIPSGANLPVTLLKAVPYGMHAPKSRSATVCPAAPQQRPSATRGHANRPRPDHQARTDDLASPASLPRPAGRSPPSYTGAMIADEDQPRNRRAPTDRCEAVPTVRPSTRSTQRSGHRPPGQRPLAHRPNPASATPGDNA